MWIMFAFVVPKSSKVGIQVAVKLEISGEIQNDTFIKSTFEVVAYAYECLLMAFGWRKSIAWTLMDNKR